MKKSNYELVKDFHDKYRLFSSKTLKFPNEEQIILRIRLIAEEFAELIKGFNNKDMSNVAKELADILYVVYGTAYCIGIPIDEVFKEVHKSNMSKDGGKDFGGKLVKGQNYKEPDIWNILIDNTEDE